MYSAAEAKDYPNNMSLDEMLRLLFFLAATAKYKSNISTDDAT